MTTLTASQRLSNKTKRVVMEMLTENTGIAMCDSGGKDGRGWQRRRAAGLITVKAWDALPAAKIDDVWVRDNELTCADDNWSVTLDVYHFLTSYCEYAPKLDGFLQRFLKKNDSIGIFCVEEEFQHQLSGWASSRVLGAFGARKLVTHYTYNEENSLSADIQFCLFEIEEPEFRGDYAIIQTHNGADARGGLSTARLFAVADIDSFISGYSRYHIECGQGHSWMVDGSDHWWDGCSSAPEASLLKQPLHVLGNAAGGKDLLCPICNSILVAHPYGT